MSFNTYVQSYIGGLSGTVGWDVNTINFVVTEALEAYGVSTEAEATDSVKAHALLRYKTVERILVDISGDFDYKADGESYSRSQFFEQVRKMWSKVSIDALPYLGSGQIVLRRVTFPDDPYSIQGQIEHDA